MDGGTQGLIDLLHEDVPDGGGVPPAESALLELLRQSS